MLDIPLFVEICVFFATFIVIVLISTGDLGVMILAVCQTFHVVYILPKSYLI